MSLPVSLRAREGAGGGAYPTSVHLDLHPGVFLTEEEEMLLFFPPLLLLQRCVSLPTSRGFLDGKTFIIGVDFTESFGGSQAFH